MTARPIIGRSANGLAGVPDRGSCRAIRRFTVSNSHAAYTWLSNGCASAEHRASVRSRPIAAGAVDRRSLVQRQLTLHSSSVRRGRKYIQKSAPMS